MDAFATADLEATAAAVQAALDERGVGFGAASEHSRFLVDPVPRVIEADEWDLLRRGLAQRGRALAAFVADVYGERAICAAGVVPERVVESAEYLERDLLDCPPTRFGWIAGLDLVGGVIEGLEAPARDFCVGVQWHAESMVDRREQANLFRGLVDASMRFEAEDVRELAA